jgi:hypothetical protein
LNPLKLERLRWHKYGPYFAAFRAASLAASKPPAETLSRLIPDLDRQGIFRKEQTFVAICLLWNKIDEFRSSTSNSLVLLS